MLSRNFLQLRRMSFLTCLDKAFVSENETAIGVLDNGIKVATEHTSSPFACVSLFIQTGPRYEAPKYNGISHFIEHMAFKGSCTFSKQQIEDFTRCSGARLDAKTYHEFQRFSVMCTPEHLQDAVTLLSGIIWKLDMDYYEIEQERQNIALEMMDADVDYKKLVFENLVQSAFHGTSLGQKVIGSSCNLESFDSEIASAYMQCEYQPWKAAFTSAAPISNGCMMSLVKNAVGCLQTTQQETVELDTRFSAGSVIYRDDSRDFAHIIMALEAPGFVSQDYLSMLVLKNIIGSWSKGSSVFGAWPELAMRCTDTELCESYKSIYLSFQDVGLWGVYFVCGRLEAEDFVVNWQDVVKSMCCMLSYADVARAKRATLLELFKYRQGAYNSSLNLGKEIMYRGYRPSLSEYVTALNALDVGELQSLAYRVIYGQQPVVSAAGPTECLIDYTRLAAGQYWIRW